MSVSILWKTEDSSMVVQSREPDGPFHYIPPWEFDIISECGFLFSRRFLLSSIFEPASSCNREKIMSFSGITHDQLESRVRDLYPLWQKTSANPVGLTESPDTRTPLEIAQGCLVQDVFATTQDLKQLLVVLGNHFQVLDGTRRGNETESEEWIVLGQQLLHCYFRTIMLSYQGVSAHYYCGEIAREPSFSGPTWAAVAAAIDEANPSFLQCYVSSALENTVISGMMEDWMEFCLLVQALLLARHAGMIEKTIGAYEMMAIHVARHGLGKQAKKPTLDRPQVGLSNLLSGTRMLPYKLCLIRPDNLADAEIDEDDLKLNEELLLSLAVMPSNERQQSEAFLLQDKLRAVVQTEAFFKRLLKNS